LHKKFAELSGSINRIFELEELLDSAQSGTCLFVTIYTTISCAFGLGGGKNGCFLTEEQAYVSTLYKCRYGSHTTSVAMAAINIC
jgi:hypothetical protein